jgi:hypothetical protein
MDLKNFLIKNAYQQVQDSQITQNVPSSAWYIDEWVSPNKVNVVYNLAEDGYTHFPQTDMEKNMLTTTSSLPECSLEHPQPTIRKRQLVSAIPGSNQTKGLNHELTQLTKAGVNIM